MADEIFSAVAPEPVQTEVAVQQQPSFSPRFSAEDRANILGSNDPDALKSFAKSLTQDELAALEDPARGLDSLFSASANAQQEFDPAAAAAPVAAPAATPEQTPPVGDAEPATGDPEWLMTDEEFAAAPPKVQALYKEFAEALEKLDSAKEPDPDKYAEDPVIAWRRKALETGNLDLPDVDVNDLVNMTGGTIDDLWSKLDQAHVDQDPRAWETALKNLFTRVSDEVKARVSIKAQSSVEDAFKAGRTITETRYELMDFIKNVPEFKASGERLFVRRDDGSTGLNDKNPAAKFVEYFKSKANVFDPILASEGPRTAIELAWTAFSKEQSGGYNQMMAKVREQAMSSVVQRMKSTANKHFSSIAAPSIGAVRTPVSSAQAAMYHGVDLNSLQTKADVDRAIQLWRSTNNGAAIDGFEAAIRGVRRN